MDRLCEASCEQGASSCCELLTKLLSLHNAGWWFLISKSEIIIRPALSFVGHHHWPTSPSTFYLFVFFIFPALVLSFFSVLCVMCWIFLPAYLSWWSYKQTNNLCAWPRTSSLPPGSRSCRGTKDTPSICCPGPFGQKSKMNSHCVYHWVFRQEKSILVSLDTLDEQKKTTHGHLKKKKTKLWLEGKINKCSNEKLPRHPEGKIAASCHSGIIKRQGEQLTHKPRRSRRERRRRPSPRCTALSQRAPDEYQKTRQEWAAQGEPDESQS